MKKILGLLIFIGLLIIGGYFTFYYNAIYSEGVRSGELIKFSKKGVVFKTYEGEISQGISGAQIFTFSVLDSETKVIADLKSLEGQFVKLTYEERYKSFPWWGDSKYFIVDVKKGKSIFERKKE